MSGPYAHDIDPIIVSVWGIHLWWYGLSYSIGFLNAHLFLRRNRQALGLSLRAVYDLTLLLAAGVLIGGRVVVVFNNEWAFYRDHLHLIPALWIGGLATHGLIGGGAAGVLAFSIAYRRPIRPLLDALAIPTALILGCGRVGNFIDGKIVGSLTDVPWAVRFPDVEGFRHPVVLYDGAKNFLLVPVLLWVRRRGAPPGRLSALFVVLYAALRIPVDLLREYPIVMWGLPTGQTLNILMAGAGLVLLERNCRRTLAPEAPCSIVPAPGGDRGGRWRPCALVACLVLAMTIPSDATRDIPAEYGHRHEGLTYSRLYPRVRSPAPSNGDSRGLAGVGNHPAEAMGERQRRVIAVLPGGPAAPMCERASSGSSAGQSRAAMVWSNP